jgi:hypothetical protein
VTDTDRSRGPFRQLVFSGGGTRCFWQGGFLDVTRDVLPVDPARITGVSGGALSAAAFIAHKGHALLEAMAEIFAARDTNVNWHDPAGEGGVTPHQRMYRQVVEDVFRGEGLAAVAEGPAFQILLGHPPASALDRLTGTLSTAAYEAELHSGGGPHFAWAEKVGVESSLIDARQAARDGRLTDLICAAAAIPPVFEPPLWDGRPVIDGGMVDQAPMPDPDEGPTLVLLTREYGSVPDRADRTYVPPSREVPADKIDFTEPADIRRSWEIGEADGRRFLEGRRADTD